MVVKQDSLLVKEAPTGQKDEVLANMTKLWKRLKKNPVKVTERKYQGAIVEVISLPEGLYWITENSRHLFVRQCDKELYDIVMALNNGPYRGAVVLGNPGIGKGNMPLKYSSCEQGRAGSYRTAFIGWLRMRTHETRPYSLNQFN